MMTRREMLTRVLGATVAAAVAPLVDLTDQTAAFWRQSEVAKRLPWRIVFSDGTTFSFGVEVIAEEIDLTNDTIQLTVRPVGPVTVGQEVSTDVRTTISMGQKTADLMEIGLPLADESYEESVIGLLQPKKMKFTVRF